MQNLLDHRGTSKEMKRIVVFEKMSLSFFLPESRFLAKNARSWDVHAENRDTILYVDQVFFSTFLYVDQAFISFLYVDQAFSFLLK
jgi:hypothetical protein